MISFLLALAMMQTGRAQDPDCQPSHYRPYVAYCIGADGKLLYQVDAGTAPPVADGAETVKPQGGSGGSGKWTLYVPPETDLLDVPAIQKKRQFRDFPEHVIECGMAESLDLRGLMEYCLKEFPYYSCADEDRILEHSVNGKVHTCRKVQMQVQSAVEK